MKKSIFLLASLVFLFSSFSSSNTEVPEVLQKSISIDQLKKFLEKDESNQYLPLVIVTNDNFSEKINLEFDGKKVQLFSDKRSIEANVSNSYLEVTKFKIKRNFSLLKFNYLGKKGKIKLRKKDGQWVFYSITMKGCGDYYKNADMTF